MSLILTDRGVRNGRRFPTAWGLPGQASAMDRLFDEFWRDGRLPAPRLVSGASARFVPHLDVQETEEAYVVVAELPGLDAEDFELVLEDDVLTLKGEKKLEPGAEGTTTRRAERVSGRFERSLRFPTPVDEDKVSATHRNGVLTITLPKPEEAKPRVRQIPVQTA